MIQDKLNRNDWYDLKLHSDTLQLSYLLYFPTDYAPDGVVFETFQSRTDLMGRVSYWLAKDERKEHQEKQNDPN